MFEIILGLVCLGVLAVEVIEVRQKCEESHPGLWQGTSVFQVQAASPTGVYENGWTV